MQGCAAAPMGGYGPMCAAAPDPRASPYGSPSPNQVPCGSPAPATLPAGWEQTADPNSGMTYYFSRATGETSWTPPAAPVAPVAVPAAAPALASAPATAPDAAPAAAPAAASCSPAAVPNAAEQPQPAAVAQTLPAGWESTTDPSSGKPYYFNRATGETSWTPPASVATAAAPPASS